jgi:diguanylate cyclase (GGDEF)-like protein
MCDRTEILEAALDLMDQGVAVLDAGSNVLFWNQAAASLTGFRRADMLSRKVPADLYCVDELHQERTGAALEQRERGDGGDVGFAGAIAGYANGPRKQSSEEDVAHEDRPTLVTMRHHFGHTVPAMLRKVPLRDSLGECVGAALVFHPIEHFEALPHGDTTGCAGVERSQAELEDRLDAAHHQWLANRVPFGLLWITIDQAAQLRKTHGREPCVAMLRIVEQTLMRGLRPGEILGRWGDDEFLVLSHERTAALLCEHAHQVAGLARTADFRWWGDRVSLTVSVGISLASDTESLQQLMSRAQKSMQASMYAGGNRVTHVKGE